MTIESKPFLGRCKECDYAVFAAAEDIAKVEDLRQVTAGGAATMVQGHYGVLARCPDNHRVFPLKRIEGTFSEDFKCDSRCLNAKARKCTCSCGGMNHGRGHAVQIQPATAQPKAQVVTGMSLYKDDPNWDIARHEQEQQKFASELSEEAQFTKQHLGKEGEKIFFEAKLLRRVESDHSTLYAFMTEVRTPITGVLLGLAEIKWWKPDFVDDPGYEIGEVYKLKAKVKRLEDDPKWGKSTLVTYLEEV
jgi:hypothetical protein